MSNNTWIFNCNPKMEDLPAKLASGELRAGSEEEWGAWQRRHEMRSGDRVYHWVTGPNAGLYAISELICDPSRARRATRG